MRTYRLYEPKIPPAASSLSLRDDNVPIVRNVLRLSEGDEVTLIDGCGTYAKSNLTRVSKGEAIVTVSDRNTAAPPTPRISLLYALPKGDRASDVIQDCVEWGVSQITFFETERTIPKKKDGMKDRWKRVAIEALRQSGNPYLPTIEGPHSLSEVFEATSSGAAFFFDEAEKKVQMRDHLSASVTDGIRLAVGPEGGWSDRDRGEFNKAGFLSVSLGPYILRTETAAAGAVAACRALFG